jgi:hypothetical protein
MLAKNRKAKVESESGKQIREHGKQRRGEAFVKNVS